MCTRNRRLCAAVVAALAAGLILTGCSHREPVAARDQPAKIVQIAGTDRARVTLTSDAAERIGIKTEPVRAAGGEVAVPMAAVLYDKDGHIWVYTSPKALTFERQAITIRQVDRDRALLSAGPSVGTAVVTVGGAELLGAEYGVEGE